MKSAKTDGRLYLVHEFIQGQTLKTIIARPAAQSAARRRPGGQIAEALADAHAADLVHGAHHRDTIVVTPKGHAKIADFGWRRGRRGHVAAGRGPSTTATGADADGVSRRPLLARRHSFRDADRPRWPAPGAGVPSAVNRSLPREIDPIVAQGARQERRLRIRGHAGGRAPRGRRDARRPAGGQRSGRLRHRHPAKAASRRS